MKSHRENIILNYFDPHKSLDVVNLYGWLSPDITISETDGLPWSGSYRGLKGVGDYMTNVTRYILSEIQLEETYSCGDRVVAIGRSVGKVVSTGQRFNIRLVQLFTFDENEKIVRVEFISDLPAFLGVLNGAGQHIPPSDPRSQVQ